MNTKTFSLYPSSPPMKFVFRMAGMYEEQIVTFVKVTFLFVNCLNMYDFPHYNFISKASICVRVCVCMWATLSSNNFVLSHHTYFFSLSLYLSHHYLSYCTVFLLLIFSYKVFFFLVFSVCLFSRAAGWHLFISFSMRD